MHADSCKLRRKAREAVCKIVDVFGLWRRVDKLLNDGPKIVQRCDLCEWLSSQRPKSASADREQEGCADRLDGNTTLIELLREAAIGWPDSAPGSRRGSVELEDRLDVRVMVR